MAGGPFRAKSFACLFPGIRREGTIVVPAGPSAPVVEGRGDFHSGRGSRPFPFHQKTEGRTG